MHNQIGIMGCLKERPYVMKGSHNKELFCLKLEVEKRNKDISNPQYDTFDLLIWKGKYLQITSDEFFMNKYLIVKGYLENIPYKEDDIIKEKTMIVVEDLDFLTKYRL